MGREERVDLGKVVVRRVDMIKTAQNSHRTNKIM